LRRHSTAQKAERLRAGDLWRGQDLVFCREDGTPLHPDGFYASFQQAVKRAGVRPIRFHDLRHTHATLFLSNGEHPKIVSERLGHSSIAITLDLYSHVLPGIQADAAKRVMGILDGTA